MRRPETSAGAPVRRMARQRRRGGSGAFVGRLALRRHRLLVLVLPALLLAALALVAGVRTGAMDVVRFVGKASPTDVRVCACRPDRDVEFSREDGLRIAGSLYGVGDDGVRPAVLLLHGNTPVGRQLPLYRVLARKLADRGYAVLAIDQTGFGESGDPFSLGTAEALDRGKDVRAALDYLATLPGVDPERISLVAHSGGTGPALQEGVAAPEVRAMVAVGPPRRVLERMADPADQAYFWERARETRQELYGADFPSWYTMEMFVQAAQEGAMERYLDYFAREGHKPLLLMDGELEDEADREYLRRYYESMAGPKGYVTVRGADHYANTMSLRGLVLYDRQAVGETVDAIDRGLRGVE